jgi:hypothetical protein
MLQIMLCGAADTDDIREQFVTVVSGFGALSLHYQSGEVRYTNTLTSSWTKNSLQSVLQADICVFVIVERYGDITWNTELQAALESGKPFVLLCLDRTYNRYLTLSDHVADLDAIRDPAERRLVEVLGELEYERQLTIVTFTYAAFQETLRRQLAALVKIAIGLLNIRNQREAVALTLADPQKMSHRDLRVLTELALDELEDKGGRKRAVKVLSRTCGVDDEDLLLLLDSNEQGVQRLAMLELAGLYRMRPPDGAFFDQLVDIANQSDDVGIPRRLIPALLEIDVDAAVHAFMGLALEEEGSRRRLAEALGRREDDIRRKHELRSAVLELTARCLTGPTGRDWKRECEAFRLRLQLRDDEGR